ncbi:MAG: aldehyde dehydrogenase family protein [Acidobacteria bacterium]|nr:aldehyde dehydrogenase family protein [Acidobacteriota bacterium]
MADEQAPIADDRDWLVVRSPYDGQEIGRVRAHDAGDVDAAVAAGKAALATAPLPLWRRAAILDTAAQLLSERVDDMARTIAAEAAKPLKTARVEAERAVSTFIFAAAAARTLAGEMVPLDASDVGEGKLGFTLRVPVGVIGAISPFNFPLNLVAHKVAPAIAAGCPVVLKPASQTPMSALRLERLLVDECGLPEAWLRVLPGPSSSVGERLVSHPDVAMITFTGSPGVGWSIRAKAASKKVTLELGNNAPIIIHGDADWRAAASKIKVAGFSNAGQSCISTQRVYVHRSIAEEFTSALVQEVETLKVGDPLDPDTDVSALISASDTERVASWVTEAEAAGAVVATGGGFDGTIYRPTVLTGVTPDMKVSCLEVFGPVVGIAIYDDIDDALRLANDTRYGLQAAMWTADLSLALRAARELDFGGVLVNEVPTWRADQMPYGGLRDSGNTREGPAWAVREMTDERLVVFQA